MARHKLMVKPKELPHSPAPASEPIPLLLVGVSRENREPLVTIARNAGWRLHAVPTVGQAIPFAMSTPVPVIIADRDSCGVDWRRLLERICELPCAPRLIVSSRLADETLWTEVLNLGGFDVVRTPFNPREVRAIVDHAWESWEDEVRQAGRRLPLAARHDNIQV